MKINQAEWDMLDEAIEVLERDLPAYSPDCHFPDRLKVLTARVVLDNAEIVGQVDGLSIPADEARKGKRYLPSRHPLK